MSVHAKNRVRVYRWLWLATCAAACTGTPTPEPPDDLPTPDAAGVFNGAYEVTVAPAGAQPCQISARANAVPPGSEVWIVDLDSMQSATTVIATDAGSFATDLQGSKIGDRVRMVTRSDVQHSLPLDGVCTAVNDRLVPQPLPAPPLACLSVTPVDQTAEGAPLHFHVVNACEVAVTVARAALRFGDAGFTLSTPASEIAAHGTLDVSVSAPAPGTTQQTDILLLDLTGMGQTNRYALGVWSASKQGND